MNCHELLGCVGEHAVLHIVGQLAKQESRAVSDVCAGLIESTKKNLFLMGRGAAFSSS